MMKSAKFFCLVVLLVGGHLVNAAPLLSLVKTGTTSQTNDTIGLGTGPYLLDARLDTDGNPASTLQYYLTYVSGPAGAVNYASPYSTNSVPGNPAPPTATWSNGEVVGPTPGSALGSSQFTYFAHSGSDYAAFVGNVISYRIDTAGLPIGIYVFSFGRSGDDYDMYLGWDGPPGDEVLASGFASPGSFVLTIPEPSTGVLLTLSGLVLLRRRRRAS